MSASRCPVWLSSADDLQRRFAGVQGRLVLVAVGLGVEELCPVLARAVRQVGGDAGVEPSSTVADVDVPDEGDSV